MRSVRLLLNNPYHALKKFAVENGTVLFGAKFPVPRSANSLCWLYISGKLNLILEQTSGKSVALLAAFHEIAHGCRDLPVKGAVFFEDDTDRNNHGAKFFLSMSVLHQSSWKFCTHFYFGFVALLPEHQFCTHLHFGFVALLPEHQFLHAVVSFYLRA
jgi:hypothetical protein